MCTSVRKDVVHGFEKQRRKVVQTHHLIVEVTLNCSLVKHNKRPEEETVICNLMINIWLMSCMR